MTGRRIAVAVVGVLVAVAGVLAALLYFNAHDDATISGAEGPGVMRVAQARPVVAPGNVVLLFSDERETLALRLFATREGGRATPALQAAGQAVIVRRQTGVRSPVVALTSDRRLDAKGPTDPALRDFVEYWLGRTAR